MQTASLQISPAAPVTIPATRQKAGGVGAARRKLDALPDRVDIRDWLYQPTLSALPSQIVNVDRVPKILNQGLEGACTGFALAAVINFHMHARASNGGERRRVSARMLYELARRYDEWPGENYEGSTARAAMMGFVRHGVCSERMWPHTQQGISNFDDRIAVNARKSPGGAYYRVLHRQVRDMHAALAEAGILFITLLAHDGWDQLDSAPAADIDYVGADGHRKNLSLPIIPFRKAHPDDGHAVALVGYTRDGFIVQNSWGTGWGAGGFAILAYDDYIQHATDAWVLQLGVPVSADVWVEDRRGGGRSKSVLRQSVPREQVRPYAINLGNNGELSDRGSYWTTPEDVTRLVDEIRAFEGRRIALYLHGGLNDEQSVARRIRAFAPVFLANGAYPLHIMWETGLLETVQQLAADQLEEERAGAAGDWWGRFRDGVAEARDRTIELTLARPGRAVWGKMKQNARFASQHPEARGGMQMLSKQFKRAGGLKGWQVDIIAHSAGSIWAGHALRLWAATGARIGTVQLLAPAVHGDTFNETFISAIKDGICPRPSAYVLNDAVERADTVGPYGKSLLYLVSNAFEERRRRPIVGMRQFIDSDATLKQLFAKPVDGRAAVVTAQETAPPPIPDDRALYSMSTTHGGFDNDVQTLNSVLTRMLDRYPAHPFTSTHMDY